MLNRASILRSAVFAAACGIGVGLSSATAAEPKSVPLVGMGAQPANQAANQPANRAEAPRQQITGDGKAETTLTLDVRKFDFEGTKAANRLYLPKAAVLSNEKPEVVTREPAYNGIPRYATIGIGSAAPDRFTLVSDEAEGKEPRIYLDLNGDGDLTNDQTGDWLRKETREAGTPASYSGTWTFAPGWRQPDGNTTRGEYALNLYWQPGRSQLNYYAASARVGTIAIENRKYDVTLLENDADGRFNKLHDAAKPIVVGDRPSSPVWLLLDGDQFDIRGTFSFGGLNYLATVSDDGSSLHLAPTIRSIQPPRPAPQKSTLLAAGAQAPDFEALGWNAGQTKVDTSNRFKLSDYRGKIVVIDMWATWCGPCMKGIPHLSKVAEAVSGQDVVVIALNTSDDQAAFENFAGGKGKDYKFQFARDPAGRDESGNTIARRLYGVTGIPATFVIDKSGKIAGTVSGYREGDTALEQLLKGLGVKID